MFRLSGSTDDAADLVRTYSAALDGLPDFAVLEAAKRFLQGRVKDYNPRFPPMPPQWAIEARAIVAERIAANAPKPAAMLEKPVCEETRRKVKELFSEWRSNHGPKKPVNNVLGQSEPQETPIGSLTPVTVSRSLQQSLAR